jgi:hypothetical protein
LEHAENCGEVDSVNGIDLIWFIVFNTTCNNISAISWWQKRAVHTKSGIYVFIKEWKILTCNH